MVVLLLFCLFALGVVVIGPIVAGAMIIDVRSRTQRLEGRVTRLERDVTSGTANESPASTDRSAAPPIPLEVTESVPLAVTAESVEPPATECETTMDSANTREAQSAVELEPLDIPEPILSAAPSGPPETLAPMHPPISSPVDDAPQRAAATEQTSPEPEPVARAPRRAIDWEVFTAGRLFSIIGAIMIIVGGGLLMKYAIDHAWFPPSLYGETARVLCGFAAGAVLLFAGDRQLRSRNRDERTWFGQALVGSGLGSLYVSGYAACASAQLVSLDASFAIMSVVTTVAFALAFRYDAFAIALIGWFGAFVTPFVVDDPNVDQSALAAYLVLLDLGLCAIALAKRTWFALAPLALVASSLASAWWFLQHGTNAAWYVSALALVSSWAIFFATGIVARSREDRRAVGYGALGEIANVAVLRGYLPVALVGHSLALHTILGVVVAAFGAAYVRFVKRGASALVRATYGGLGLLAAFDLSTLVIHDSVDRAVAFAVAAIVIAGVSSKLAHATIDRREALVGALATFALAIVNSLAAWTRVWGYVEGPLGATTRNGDLAALAIVIGAFALDRLVAMPANALVTGRALRAIGAAAALTLLSAHLSGFELAAAYALVAIVVSALARVARANGARAAGFIEAPIAAAVALVLGVGTYTLSHDAFATRDAFSSADLALALLVGALFGYERFTRDLLAKAPLASIALRVAGITTSLALVFAHARGIEASTYLALEAMLVLGIDRAVRRFGGLFGSPTELFATLSTLLLAAAFGLVLGPATFAYRGGTYHLGISGNDLAIFVVGAASAMLAFAARRDGAREFALGGRILVTLVALSATAAHARDYGLVAAYALESLACAALARHSARTGAPRAFDIERFVRACALALAALIVDAQIPGAFAFRGTSFAFGIGGADLALALATVAAFVLSRVAVASAYRHEIVVVLRQIAALLAGASICAHASDERFVAAFALAALGWTLCSAVARRNADPASSLEFAIDAFISLAASDVAVAFAHPTWVVEHLVRYVPFANERFGAIACAAFATIAIGTYHLRGGLLPRRGALALRALGIGLAVFDLTIDVRDSFGAAIARALNDLASPESIAHLQTLEAVALSLAWVAASVVLLALGIRMRARDLRFCALALFDLTILKAFFVDLATPDALERIVAFIGLGLVLLGISYAYQRFERRLVGDPTPNDPNESSAPLAA